MKRSVAMGLRTLLWTTLALLLTALILLALLTTALSTEAGSRRALALLGNAVPGISVGASRGDWVDGIDIDRFSYSDAGVEVTLTDIHARLSWRALLVGQLRLPALRAATLLVRIDDDDDSDDSGLTRVAMPLPLIVPELGLDRLTIDTGGEPLQLEALSASIGWLGTRLRFSDAAATLGEWRAQATGTIRFSGDYPIELDGSIDSDAWRGTLTPVAVRTWGDLGRLGVELKTDGDWPATITGSVWLLEQELRLQFVAEQTRPLGWGDGDAAIGVQGAVLTARGTLDAITGELKATLTQPQFGAMPLTAAIEWQGDRLTFAPTLTVADGALQGQCALQLAEPFPLDCDGELRQLALQSLGVDATVSTPFQLELSDPTLPALQLALPAIDGTLLGRPLRGTAQLATADGERWQIDQLQLQSGDNTLQVGGWIGSDSRLQVQLDARALAQLDPTLNGALTLQAQLTGNIAAPTVTASVDGRDLTLDEQRIGQLHGELALVDGGRAPSRLQLSASVLQLPGLPPIDLTLRGSGTAAEHRLQLAASADEATLRLACSGRVELEQPRGRLRCDTLNGQLPLPRATVDWSAGQTLALDWQAQPTRATLAPFCLRADSASLCLKQPLALRDGRLAPFTAEAQALPLRWARGWLPNQLRPGADSVANLQLALTRSQPLRLDARIDLPASTWQLRGSDGRVSLPLEPAHVALQLDERRAVVDGRLAVVDLGAATLRLTVDDPRRARTLDGALDLDAIQLQTLGSAIDGVDVRGGELSGRVDLRGTLAAPALIGRLSVRGGELQVGMAVDPITELTLDAGFDQRSATLGGSFRSGAGSGVIGGSAQWPDDAPWQARLTLNGAALRIAPLPDSELTLDAQLALDASAQRNTLTGGVQVRQADIRINELPPETVSVSPDAVVVGRVTEPTALEQLAIDVGVALGDQFRFSGFGADVRLTGNLQLLRQPGQSLLGDGTVRLADGRYRAYGQRLRVRRGSFLFTGPLDNPALDIEAVRELAPVVGYDDVEVGLQVTGSLQDPLARIFSKPSMPESNAAYYLLTGRPPPTGTTGTEFSAGGTLLSLGLLGGEEQAARLAQRFGISDLQISTSQGDNGTQAEVSGYLADRLYVRYGAGLDKQGNTITFQYQLTKRLVIEALSGLNDALDLIYTFTID